LALSCAWATEATRPTSSEVVTATFIDMRAFLLRAPSFGAIPIQAAAMPTPQSAKSEAARRQSAAPSFGGCRT
jgi:hypothetical protein